ncbi:MULTISPECIES: response regulator [Synechocystis]|uniref:Response regulator n=1 Tax=Synechocystis salina LEGE 00031 TaxID=1828736 RepID=A0ABR9VSK3_9SYNC|nr:MULTISPECIES: response regulator [Synechocystis]MBE9240745.1 response regulator [Synechocystis salina LEGE 00041]MBE9254335.1 response regulator [Synechocystis salina LEGE 00031]
MLSDDLAGGQRTFKVLVVEDDRVTRSLLLMALKEDNYGLAEATNGQECLDKFIQLQPDIVLLDAIMPGMDGFTCCEQIRLLPGGDKVPILMITFLDDQESIDKAFTAGATDYINKPIHWSSFRRRIHQLINVKSLFNEVEATQKELVSRRSWDSFWQENWRSLAQTSPNQNYLNTMLTGALKLFNGLRIVLVTSIADAIPFVVIDPEVESMGIDFTAINDDFAALVSLQIDGGIVFKAGVTPPAKNHWSTKLPSMALFPTAVQPVAWRGQPLGRVIIQWRSDLDLAEVEIPQQIENLSHLLGFLLQEIDG